MVTTVEGLMEICQVPEGHATERGCSLILTDLNITLSLQKDSTDSQDITEPLLSAIPHSQTGSVRASRRMLQIQCVLWVSPFPTDSSLKQTIPPVLTSSHLQNHYCYYQIIETPHSLSNTRKVRLAVPQHCITKCSETLSRRVSEERMINQNILMPRSLKAEIAQFTSYMQSILQRKWHSGIIC